MKDSNSDFDYHKYIDKKESSFQSSMKNLSNSLKATHADITSEFNLGLNHVLSEHEKYVSSSAQIKMKKNMDKENKKIDEMFSYNNLTNSNPFPITNNKNNRNENEQSSYSDNKENTSVNNNMNINVRNGIRSKSSNNINSYSSSTSSSSSVSDNSDNQLKEKLERINDVQKELIEKKQLLKKLDKILNNAENNVNVMMRKQNIAHNDLEKMTQRLYRIHRELINMHPTTESSNHNLSWFRRFGIKVGKLILKYRRLKNNY